MTPSALRPIELATHATVGAGTLPATSSVRQADPAATLAGIARELLRAGPVFVSFSGGLDSTLVLAMLTQVARAEGLSAPVPITWRFRDAPRAEESARQDTVVASLGLTDWIQLRADDDLDVVGPVATAVLREHGLLYPANSFLHAPLLEQARGATLVTGVGGDQLFGRIHRPRRPWPVAKPGPVASMRWLQPAAASAHARALARQQRSMPRQEIRRPRWRLERRNLTLALESLAALAASAGAHVAHPLADPALVDAVAAGGLTTAQAGGRAALIGALFGGSVPEVCVAPHPKATFGEVYWRTPTRDHVRRWDGSGIDESVVAADALRREWGADAPSLSTALLVQQTWLHEHASLATPTPTPTPSTGRDHG